MLFKLNYTVLQVTSSRLLVEVKPLKTFNQQINTKSRLVYCLNHASMNTPIVRGTLDMSEYGLHHHNHHSHSHQRRYYLAIESLQPNTTYVFLAYLKTNQNSDSSNYVQIVANRTIDTPIKASPQTSSLRPIAAKVVQDYSDEDDGE